MNSIYSLDVTYSKISNNYDAKGNEEALLTMNWIIVFILKYLKCLIVNKFTSILMIFQNCFIRQDKEFVNY